MKELFSNELQQQILLFLSVAAINCRCAPEAEFAVVSVLRVVDASQTKLLSNT
jgi:hypothetical protein